MKTELITETHKEWLKNNLGLTIEEVEAMTDEENEKLCNDLLMLECDALDGERDDLETINEVQDIIFDEKPDDDEE